MYCLKCGKEIAEQQVFCESCLTGMADYPVKPDVKVTLPHRTESTISYPRKRPPQPEEQLFAMRRQVRRLRMALACFAALLAISVAALLYTYNNGETTPTIGRNYMIDTTSQP